MKKETESYDLKFESQHIGLIIIDSFFSVAYCSNSVKEWFGSSIHPKALLPKEFHPAKDGLHVFHYEGSSYINICCQLTADETPYQALIFFNMDCFKEHFPRNINLLYGVYYNEIKAILDCVSDGIYITDGDGCTLMLNKAAEKSWSLPVNELAGENLLDLYKKLYPNLSEDEIVQQSVCLQVVRSKAAVSIIQSGKNDRFKILSTGTPYFIEGNLSMVVSTERNLTELIQLRKQLEQNIKINSRNEAQLEYYRSLYYSEHKIIVKDKKMESLLRLANKVANQNITVLLQGESGVGKEIFARFIHNNSPRKNMPFIDINCAAIPENLLESELFGYEKGAFTGASASGKIGLFELADKGTLFLDELDDLPIHLQSKILRAIQERKILRIGGSAGIPIDVRIISAVNRNLKEAVEKDLFREDLYYRLNVIKLVIPPLRERKGDIPAFVSHYLQLHNKNYQSDIKISPGALKVLKDYSWPGNVRELSNVMEAAYATCINDTITSDQLLDIFPEMKNTENAPNDGESFSLKSEMERYEKHLLQEQMSLYHSAQSLANALKIDKSTLIRKMHRYGIENPYVPRR